MLLQEVTVLYIVCQELIIGKNEKELLASDSPKGEVKLGFLIQAAGWYFPELYPTTAKQTKR